MTQPDADPFEGREPVAGLEHLGRAIVDSHGFPSGSPANYEHTRGRDFENLPSQADAEAMIESIRSQLASEFPE